jgi:hypothetical protein
MKEAINAKGPYKMMTMEKVLASNIVAMDHKTSGF